MIGNYGGGGLESASHKAVGDQDRVASWTHVTKTSRIVDMMESHG